MPGGEGMGTFGIDWAIKCYQLPIRLPVYSLGFLFFLPFFFAWEWGRGERATALSQKQPCFRARSHESGYFWDCMSFFTPIDLSSTRNQWARSPKPETKARNPKPASFQNRSSECPKTPSTRIRVKNVRFQLGFNPVSNKPIPDRKCCIPRNDHRIDFATYFHLL